FQAEDGIRYLTVTGVQTCALPIWRERLGGPLVEIIERRTERVGLAPYGLRDAGEVGGLARHRDLREGRLQRGIRGTQAAERARGIGNALKLARGLASVLGRRARRAQHTEQTHHAA